MHLWWGFDVLYEWIINLSFRSCLQSQFETNPILFSILIQWIYSRNLCRWCTKAGDGMDRGFIQTCQWWEVQRKCWNFMDFGQEKESRKIIKYQAIVCKCFYLLASIAMEFTHSAKRNFYHVQLTISIWFVRHRIANVIENNKFVVQNELIRMHQDWKSFYGTQRKSRLNLYYLRDHKICDGNFSARCSFFFCSNSTFPCHKIDIFLFSPS